MVEADTARRREAETLLRAAVDMLDRNGPSDRAAAIAASHISLAIEHLNPAGYMMTPEDVPRSAAASPEELRASPAPD